MYQSFSDCTGRTNYNRYHGHFHVPLFFLVHEQGLGTHLSFHLLFSFTQRSARTAKSTIRQVLFFIWSRLDDPFVSKSQRILCLIFLDGFWVMQIPLVRMVKFTLLGQFPVDYLLHPIESSPKLYWRVFHISVS